MVKTNATSAKQAIAKKKKGSPKRGGGKKETAETRILSALAHELSLGVTAPTKQRIASLADMTNNEGSYKTFCGIMRRKGLVAYDKDAIWLTDAGKEKAQPFLAAAPKTNAEIQEKIKERIKMKKGRAIFEFLADGYTHSKSEIAQAIGVDEGNASLNTYLTNITKYTDKSKGPNGENMFCLNDSCFPFEPRPSSMQG